MSTITRRVMGMLSVLTAIAVPLLASQAASAKVEGPFPIINDNSGACLEVYGWQTTNGATVDQWHCDGGANQLWRFDVIGYTTDKTPYPYGLIINVHSGKCLDDLGYSGSNGAPIGQYQCINSNGTYDSAQLWDQIPRHGGFEFRLGALDDLALEINGNERNPAYPAWRRDARELANGDIADQYFFWGGSNQIWGF